MERTTWRHPEGKRADILTVPDFKFGEFRNEDIIKSVDKNKSPEIFPNILWDSLKAYLRKRD